MDDIRSPSRRALLFGRLPAGPLPAAFRPPWAKPEPEFLAACTHCDACVRACPEQVLLRGADGLPCFESHAGECTFCGDCVAACEPRALQRDATTAPWDRVAVIGEACLAARGVELSGKSPAGWQSGYAADCKSVYAGSIPTQASIRKGGLTIRVLRE